MQKKWLGARFLLALLVALALVATACGSDDDDDDGGAATEEPSGSTDGDGDSPLGEPNKATGTPIKVGLITNGVGQGFDQSDDEPLAKATANWINEYRGGIGGHPIEMVVCEDKQDPSRAADCANEMVRAGVVAVVYSSSGVFEASWRPLSAAGIPTFIQAVTGKDSPQERTNTFLIQNGLASTIDGPLGLAVENDAKVLSVLAVDVPAATNNYRNGPGPQKIKDAGIELQLIPAPLGTPDMTVQAQQIVKKNPDGALNILGNDAFCIAALNGLKAAGYTGVISANEQCITENTVKAVGADLVEGIRVVANIPLSETDNESTKLYTAVLQRWAPDVEPINGAFLFLAMAAFDVATEGIEDGAEVTPDAIIDAAKSMEWSELPGSGGRHFRCNGKADPEQPAVCTNALLYASLDGEGKAQQYEVVSDDEIPD